MKKTLSWLLVAAMTLSLLCALPFGAAADERPVITIAREADPFIEDLDTNYITRTLEEKFNVDIQWVVYPVKEAATKFGIVAQSLSEMPDVANISLNANTAYNLGKQGLLLPLDDYFANPDLCPEWYRDVPEDVRTFMLNAMRAPDGKVYDMPFYAPEGWTEYCYRMFINQEWLDALGMETPTNTEEFRNMLYRFVNDDPNGNGKKDEYGLVTLPSGYGCNPIVFLMNAFIQCNPDNCYFYVEDGVVKPAYMQKEWLEGLTYLNDLCENDLISPMSFTIDWASLQAIANADTTILGAYQGGTCSLWTGSEYGVNGKKYDLIAPITGPNGFRFATRRVRLPLQRVNITADCENPELAFRMLAYCYDHDMSLSGRYGEKGVNWTDDPEIIKQAAANYTAAGAPTAPEDIALVLLTNHWGEINNENMRNGQPAYFDFEKDGKNVVTLEPQGDVTQKNAATKCKERYYPLGPDEVISLSLFTDEELEELSVIKVAIDSYVTECTVGFVTGSMDLTEWDKFQSTLEAMQIDRYTEIMQNSYDRSLVF